MNFVFNQMAAYNDTPYASLMVQSILKEMPDSRIMQISDRDAKRIPGVLGLVRGNFVYNDDVYARAFFDRLLMVHADDHLVYCDADMIFSGDISEVLEGDFDIALCRRPQNDGTSISYRVIHPYNIGLMVFKNREFLEVCQSVMHTFFMGSEFGIAQHVVGLAVNSGEFKVKFLDSETYNHTPKDVHEFDPNVKVWHFKGERKAWMQEWQQAHIV